VLDNYKNITASAINTTISAFLNITKN